MFYGHCLEGSVFLYRVDLTLVRECNLTMKDQLTKVHSTGKLVKCLDIVLCFSSGFNITK